MRKIILSLLSFFFIIPLTLSAQLKSIVVEGRVSDQNNKPLEYATIQNTTTLQGASTNAKGYYSFKTSAPDIFKASLIGYKTTFGKITAQEIKDTVIINFTLQVDSTQIQQVDVAATHEPQLIRESGSFIDFDISNSDLLLIYEHSHGDQIIAYDSSMHKLPAMQLKYHVEELLRDEHSDIYYTHRDSVYFLYYDSMAHSFEQFSLDKNYYNSFEPVKASNPPYYYYARKAEMNSGISYIAYNTKNKEQNVFYTYTNPKILLYNEERVEDMFELENLIFSLWGISGGVKARGYQGDLRSLSVMDATFYSQIRVINDSIYIFNFNNDSISVFDDQNKLKRMIPIGFSHKKTAISKMEILTDDAKTECYFKYELYGVTYLQKIDLNSGKGLSIQTLKFPFIEKLRILGNYAYYTYSSGGGNEAFIRYLYRQRIN